MNGCGSRKRLLGLLCLKLILKKRRLLFKEKSRESRSCTVKKATMEFITDEMRKKLILEIQKFPCLYDSSKESYHIKQAKSNAWSRVAEACGCHGKEDVCKLVWKRLREKYKRVKDRMANNPPGDAATTTKVWNLYPAMSFIAPFFQPQETNPYLILGCEKIPPTKLLLRENEAESGLAAVVDFTGETKDAATDVNGTTTNNIDIEDNVVDTSAESSTCPSTSSLLSLTDVRGECTSRFQKCGCVKNRKRKARSQLNESLNLDTQSQTIVDSMTNDDSHDSIDLFYLSLAAEMKNLKRTKRLELQIQFMELTHAALQAAETEN